MEKRFGVKTLLVSIGCLGGAISGGYYLYFDLNMAGTGGSGKSVGKVEKRESTVRRKSASSYVWTNVQANEELFKKDSVQTGNGGAATVRLPDGSLLDIYENSLVVMDSSTTLAVQFLRGTAVVHEKGGADKKVSVGKDGKAKVEELSAKLTKPESLARYFVTGQEEKEVTFMWELKGRSPTELMTLQISTDKRFNPNLTKVINPPDSKTRLLKVNLGPGAYFWRVLSKNVPLSEHRQFRVISAIPLQPIYPENQAKIVVQGPEGIAQFRWVNPRSSGQEEMDVTQGDHRIEFSRDPQFSSVSFSESIQPGVGLVGIRDLQSGVNYWRIRSRYGDTQAVSQIRSIEFTRIKVTPSPLGSSLPSPTPTPSPTLAGPIGVKPDSGVTFNILDKKRLAEISWEKVEGAALYEVTIYADSKSDHKKKLILRTEVENNSLDLKKLGPGDYLWTIRSMDKEKKLYSRALPWMSFSLSYGDVLPAPEVVSSEVQ